MAYNQIPGTNESNTLYGTDSDDYISGLLGNDELYGGSGGNDVIIAGPEVPVAGYSDDDRVYGDTFRYGNTHDWLDGGYGNDTLYGDSYEGGDGGNDTIYGRSGNDELNGGLGADQLFGGTGNDIYAYVDLADTITENASEGIDTVTTYYSYTLGANLENLILNGSSGISGTGNSLDNRIVGNTGSNSLYGGLGTDTLEGGDGIDGLDGGDGNDILSGGAGNDSLYGRAGTDQMSGGSGDDSYLVTDAPDVVIENASQGTDLVITSVNYTLGANVENMSFYGSNAITGVGNSLGNSIYGNAANNSISGRSGNDIIDGGSGNDILYGGSGKDTISGGLGADKFKFTLVTDGIDTIQDFNRSEGDKIQIIKSSFGATSLGQFSYNSTTGALSFDASPSDGINPVQLATLTNKPAGFSVQTDIILA